MFSHAFLAKFVVTLSCLIPILAVGISWGIRKQKFFPKLWSLIVFLQGTLVTMGYVTLESGEVNERAFAEKVGKALVSDHEGMSEVFVGFTVVAFAFSLVSLFLREEFQYRARLGVILLSLLPLGFGWKALKLGEAITAPKTTPEACRHPG